MFWKRCEYSRLDFCRVFASAFSPSSPTLFWFSILLDAFSMSSGVKGVFISAGFMIVGSSAVTAVNMFLKCSVIVLACSFQTRHTSYLSHVQ